MTDHDITTAIARVTPDLAPAELPDAIAAAANLVRVQYERWKELNDLLNAALLEVVQVHGAIETYDTVYLLKSDRDTRNVDVPGTVDAVWVNVEGDVARFSHFLVAQPFKVGACREALPADVFAALFKTEVKDRLDRKPVVVGVPTRFIKSRVTG